MIKSIKKVTVYGGTGREDRIHQFKDEFGHEYAGTGPEAKSYFRGFNQALSVIFEEKEPKK